jgi:ribonuclease HII
MEKIKKDFFEKSAWAQGRFVIGVDEVGRGCLAGPVVTAAVMLQSKRSSLIKDSKILTKTQREQAAVWIKKNSWYSIGIASHHIVDECNIYQATLRAMRKAIMHLLIKTPEPVHILIDAMPVTLQETSVAHVPIHHAPFGESWSSSIAAASIVAKVYRDALMERMHTIVPGYHLAEHKGYATKAHRQAVQELGSSIIHRESFIRQEIFVDGETDDEQLSLF